MEYEIHEFRLTASMLTYTILVTFILKDFRTIPVLKYYVFKDRTIGSKPIYEDNIELNLNMYQTILNKCLLLEKLNL